MVLACLGFFVFRLKTIPFQSWQEEFVYRHPSNSVVNATPKSQYVGPDQDVITITGTLYPEVSGGQTSIDALKRMGEQGKSYPLITGMGSHLGAYVIEKISCNKSAFLSNGAAQKIDFAMQLKKVGDSPDGLTSVLMEIAGGLINSFV